MNIDEANALVNSSNKVHFCSEPGYEFLACITYPDGDKWMNEAQLIARSITSVTPEYRLLCEAAAIVLREKIAAEARTVAKEAEAM